MSYSQDIPDDVNTIIVQTELKPDAAFKKFGKMLIKDNYTLEQVDKTFLMLATKPRTLRFGFLDMQKLTVRILAEVLENPTRIKLQIYFVNPDINESLGLSTKFDEQASLGKNTSGSYEDAFDILDEFAKKFSNDNKNISYTIEKEKDD